MVVTELPCSKASAIISIRTVAPASGFPASSTTIAESGSAFRSRTSIAERSGNAPGLRPSCASAKPSL